MGVCKLNDHHRLNEYGLDLLTYFEKGDASVVPLTPGGAAMEPYVCPGGELTIGYGCTKWFGGRDVEATDRISDEASARTLLAEQVVEYEQAVRELVTIPLNSNQYSALVCFAFNCGIKGLAGSTLLRHVNARRFDDAAEAFGMWIYATSGQHKRALRGLLRRRYAEALLSMSYQFEEACDDDFIRLKVKRPPNNIGTDQVEFKTPFKDVLIIAQRYPLPPLDEPELVLSTPIKAAPATSVIEARGNGAGAAPAQPVQPPVPQKTSASGSSEATPVALPVPAPQPTPARPAPASVPAKVEAKPVALPLPKDAAPASIEPKDMVMSKRFWGLTVTALGTTNLLPQAAQTWVTNEGNRELITWLIVVAIGFALYKYGQHKAKKPLK